MKGWLIFFQIQAAYAAGMVAERQSRASKKRSRASKRIACDPVLLRKSVHTISSGRFRGFVITLGTAERCRFGNFVVFVFDGEGGHAAESYHAFRMVLGGQPEVIHLHILVFDVGFLDPERRVLRRLSFDSHHREVFRVDPYLSTVEKF